MAGARSGPPSRRQAAVILITGAAGVFFAAVMIWLDLRGGRQRLPALAIADSIGVCFLAAGLIAWWHRPANLVGKLMVVVGVGGYVDSLQATSEPVLVVLGFWLAYLSAFISAHLALIYPDGEFRRPVERWWVAAMYPLYLGLQGLRCWHEGVGRPIGLPDSAPVSPWATVVAAFGVLNTVLVMSWILQRLWFASPSARRAHAPVWFGTLLLSALAIAGVVVSIVGLPSTVQVGLYLGYGLCLMCMPFAFLSGLLRVRLARRRVADLVEALKDTADPARLRDLLARTLDDPSLILGFWSEETNGYVDVDGRPVTLPHEGVGRVVTFVEGRDVRLAVLVHDPALAEQGPLVRATVAAARLALENARLQALLRAQPAQLAASRARLAEVALNERRAIERDLHDGLQHRLLRLSWLAGQASSTAGAASPVLDQLGDEARDAYAALRELAQGIHPAILTEHGLAAAVEEHALRLEVPMVIEIPSSRWPRPIEATAYFVILEATTNAAKHAGAGQITVSGRERPGWLTVEVTDDGSGGADPEHGSGLRGLHDRVSALGGTLTVHSAFRRGTRVVAELPCA